MKIFGVYKCSAKGRTIVDDSNLMEEARGIAKSYIASRGDVDCLEIWDIEKVCLKLRISRGADGKFVVDEDPDKPENIVITENELLAALTYNSSRIATALETLIVLEYGYMRNREEAIPEALQMARKIFCGNRVAEFLEEKQ